MTWADGTDLTKADAREVDRLCKRGRDIIELGGPAALEKQAVKQELQRRRQDFVDAHGLSCFQCGAKAGEWAAGGKNQWGKFWVLCVPCIRKPREKKEAVQQTDL